MNSPNSSAADELSENDEKKAASPETTARKRTKKPLFAILSAIAVLGVIGFIVWFIHRNEVSTDDAYTDGNAVAITPKVSGYVTDLKVNDNVRVTKGELLLTIDPRDYQTAKAQADAQLLLTKAQLESAKESLRIARIQYPAQLDSAKATQQAMMAMLEQAHLSFARQHEVDRRATTQESIDASRIQKQTSQANLEGARAQLRIAALVPEQVRLAMSMVDQRAAQVAQAQAQLDQANLNLGDTEVRAPADGFVTMRGVQLGSYVTPGQALLMIVTPEIWVTANFKESQIGRMRAGDKVDLEVDAYSDLKLKGHVQSIQFGTGARFSSFPAENATGNFVKIVQRIPIKIVIDAGLDPDRPMPLGLSVAPVVHFE